MMQQRTEAAMRANQLRNAYALGVQPPPDACEQESELHAAIIDYCREERIVCLHGSMAHRTFRLKGEPDFILAMPKGRTVYVEAKTRTGKLTPDQAAVKHVLEMNGHTYWLVRSFSEFLELVKV